MRMRRRAILALVYSKRDLLRGRVWKPTSRNIQESRDSMRISILSGSFRLARGVLSPKGVLEFITALARPLSRSSVSSSKLAGGPSNFTLPSSGLKPISFAFHRDLLLRLVEKANVAIFQIDGKKSEIQGYVWTVHALRFMALSGKRTVRQIPKTPSEPIRRFTEIFCRDKRKITFNNFMLHLRTKGNIFLYIWSVTLLNTCYCTGNDNIFG